MQFIFMHYLSLPIAPTCVLIHPDGKRMHSFGYRAETKYAELSLEKKEHKQWYFFRRFKMMLFDKMVNIC